jgi:uncharacterized protein (TIGR01319 family)
MGLTLAIDFGSTYTKIVAIDLSKEALVGVAQAKTTVDTDITDGLQAAVEKLEKKIGIRRIEPERVLACSSAAGGLRLVAVGLVKALTTKAAEEAALGAGAKLVGSFSDGLGPGDVKQIEQIRPDLILLVGGTDGGDRDTIIHNAAQVAASKLNSLVIIAGNKMASDEAKSVLQAGEKVAVVVENVLPELNELNVEPARYAIRDMFMQRITHAKGLDKAQSFVGGIIMPTPMAVLEGAKLLADGAEEEPGIGELIVVDVGGATTDVYSVANGFPSQENVIAKGLPEPYARRTVEGDLGIRYNAHSILEIAGKKKIEKKIAFSKNNLHPLDLEAAVQRLSRHVSAIPRSDMEFLIDIGLASTAVDIATQRHAGIIEIVYFPAGKIRIQRGKDLTHTGCIIGTGGVFAYGREPQQILAAACYDPNSPESLRPLKSDFFVDERYIMFAIGLLAELAPAKALRVIKRHLKKVSQTRR